MLEPGDGRRFTLEEAQTVAATTPAATAQVETPDQVVARAFKEGNLALITKNYDEAIKRFEEGLNAAPQQPALLVNLSRAFSSRGTENYSRAVAALGTRQMSRETRNAAQDDLRRAVEAAAQAVDLIKVQPIPENDDDRKRQETNRYFALNARYQSLRTLVTFDASQAEAALAAFQEYIEIEDDAPKKSRAELDAARMLLDSKNYGLCLEQYRQILVREPNEIEALAGLGLAIYRSGDRQRSVEATGYLKRFMQEAPQSHELRPAVSEALRKLSSFQ
jgi:tetratricopeptide (TPR) repeat protein